MDEADFMSAIRQDPNDDRLRLSFADFLAERGDHLAPCFCAWNVSFALFRLTRSRLRSASVIAASKGW
jgi:uncharacterized protein (TIGR02996 family)